MNCYEDFLYDLTANQTVEIVRCQSDEEYVSIPDTIDGKPVTVIRTHAFAGTEVSEVIVPEGVEVIESEAFALCECLRRIELPQSLARLGKGVFKGCEVLTEILFPHGNDRFVVADGILYHLPEKALVCCPPGLKLELVQVPHGIETISSAAFYSNQSLRLARLPVTLRVIESEAFLFTNALRMVELPPHLERIEPGSFLMASGPFAEKQFMLYAFPNTVGYRYAEENRIPVQPLYAIVTD